MNGLNKMNTHKEEWMFHAQVLIPHIVHTVQTDDGTPMSVERAAAGGIAVQKTARAVSAGIALAAIDGPLPVMDVVGFGVAVTGSALAWYEFFTTT